METIIIETIQICIDLLAVEFRDALAIHYEWALMTMPPTVLVKAVVPCLVFFIP